MQSTEDTELAEKINKHKTVQIAKSTLTLFHRPSKKTMPLLKQLKKITLCVTVQGLDERVEEVKLICDENGIRHFHIDLDGANEQLLAYKLSIDLENSKKVKASLKELIEILKEKEENCLLHCAAGIHRTGMFGYTLLRLLANMKQKQAFKALEEMRVEAYKGVEAWRIDRAEKELVQDYLMETYKQEPQNAIAEADEDESESDNEKPDPEGWQQL